MWFLDFIVLVVLGLLGISAWLKNQQPKVSGQIGKLEAFEGWIGVAGLVWGIVLLLQWLSVGLRYDAGMSLVALIIVLVILAMSLILAIGKLRVLFGSNAFIDKLGGFSTKLAPYRLGLGFACLFLALYMLFALARFHAL